MNYYEVEPEKSTFGSAVADITHKCNMECANCYIPNRDIPDMDIDKFYDVVSRLPKRTDIRLMGGEATMRKDLPEVISKVRQLGHRPTLCTNGLKLGNLNYTKSLWDAGLRSLTISLNGADDDDVYEIMDELRCAERKIKALHNLAKFNFFINVNCILQKGVNDHVPERLLKIFKEDLKNHPGVLRFRNVGQLGRYTLEKEQNHTWDQLITKFAKITGKSEDYIRSWNNVEGYKEKYNVLFPLDENNKRKTQWIKITNWSPDDSDIPDPDSKRRGRITQDFKIAPFFEHVALNEFGY